MKNDSSGVLIFVSFLGELNRCYFAFARISLPDLSRLVNSSNPEFYLLTCSYFSMNDVGPWKLVIPTLRMRKKIELFDSFDDLFKDYIQSSWICGDNFFARNSAEFVNDNVDLFETINLDFPNFGVKEDVLVPKSFFATLEHTAGNNNHRVDVGFHESQIILDEWVITRNDEGLVIQ